MTRATSWASSTRTGSSPRGRRPRWPSRRSAWSSTRARTRPGRPRHDAGGVVRGPGMYGRARDGDGDHAELPRSDPGPVGMDGDLGPSGAGGLHRVHGGEQVMALKVAGLDLSMTATGVARTGDDDQSGCTHLIKSTGKGDRRLVDIRSQVLDYVSGCELVLIEDLPTHAHSAGITGMVHGAVREGLLSAGIPYATVPPATLKKY